MPKRRISLYVDGDVYDRVQELLKLSPRPMPISGLVEGLLEDFYQNARLGPELEEMSPAEREVALSRQAVQNFLELAREVELTMHKAQEGGVVKT
jgi:hypothetical protein